jgi:tetratricopeptide (TPR) repeat protein
MSMSSSSAGSRNGEGASMGGAAPGVAMRSPGRRAGGASWSGRVALACGVGFLALSACGGSQQEAKSPDPVELLGSSDDGAATASSDTVRQGMSALEAGDYEKARDILAQARAEQPTDPQAAFYHGVALEGLDDVAGATAAYRDALELDPKLTEASQNLSAILVDQGDARGALEAADAGLTHRPDDPGLLANRALALEALGSDEALAAYAKALTKSNDAGLRYNYASALAAADRRDEAIAQLKQIPTNDPEFAAAVATTFYQLRSFAECAQVLDKAIAKNPSADLHVRRGACRQGAEDKAGALTDYQTAVKLDGSFAAARYYLGRFLAGEGKKAEARTALEKAVELGAGTPIEASAKKVLADLK